MSRLCLNAWICTQLEIAAVFALMPFVHASAHAAEPAAPVAHKLVAGGLDEPGDLLVTFDRELFEALKDRTTIHSSAPHCLQCSQRLRQSIQLPVSVDETIELRLERFDVLAPQSRFLRGDARNPRAVAPTPDVVLLRGDVAGEPGSHAYLALTAGGGGSGWIARHNGRTVHLSTQRDQAGREIGMRIHAGESAIPDAPQFCRVEIPPGEPARREPAEGGIAGGGAGPSARGVRALVVAVDADQAFTQLFPDDRAAQEYIVQLIGAISDLYMRELNFRLILGFSRTWPDGGEPFSAASLAGFRSYWQLNENLAGLNLVHMFSGRRDTSYGGIAYLTNACSTFAFGISSFMLGGFPTPVGQPHLGNWDLVVVAHEMGHNLGTLHTHDYRPPIDTCTSGTQERGTIMSYCHTRPGGLLNIDLRMHTRVQQVIAANNPEGPPNCLWHDCNGNGVNDTSDVALGFSADADGDGVPDECQDCNANGVLDSAEIAAGAPDLNANGIPDECEDDCNGNGLPDHWEIALGLSADLNGNGIPDQCEPDCDSNGVADFLDILTGASTDYDRDSVPDICQDCNRNGVADWIDCGRQFNIFLAQDGAPIREYHARSGVLVQTYSAAALDIVHGLAFGSDRLLYVASRRDDRITRLDPDSGLLTTFVPSGTRGLKSPSSLAFGPSGDLFVASQGSNNILRFNGTTGAFISVFVPALSGGLVSPWDVAFGPGGHLYVISGDDRVLRYNGASGAFLGVVADASTGLAGARDMVFLPSGHLLVTNRAANNVMRYGALGHPMGQFNDSFPLTAPLGIALGSNGHVYVMRTAGDLRLIEYEPDSGRYIRSFVRGDLGLTSPTTFAFRPGSPHDLNGNFLPDECDGPCPADINGSGSVNMDDLLAMLFAWGACPGPCPADIAPAAGRDGVVDFADVLALIGAWGPCP